METIAITEWHGLVSPVYDASCQIGIWNGPCNGTIKNVRAMSIGEKSQLCVNANVTTLICGAISTRALLLLNVKGVTVLSWICGSVEEITDAFYHGQNVQELFAMPGSTRSRCGGGRLGCRGNGGNRHRGNR